MMRHVTSYEVTNRTDITALSDLVVALSSDHPPNWAADLIGLVPSPLLDRWETAVESDVAIRTGTNNEICFDQYGPEHPSFDAHCPMQQYFMAWTFVTSSG